MAVQRVASFSAIRRDFEEIVADVVQAVWELYRQGSPQGVGYDPRAYWRQGPDDPGYHLLRMDPWRIQVLRGRDLAGGRPSRIWAAPST
ncbi:hypothetical protein [Nonomuraea dietziae]|uniref:hypothetical protein n=1 Tax=Nonomuraea dietziae TaxID=65515 RepID=UPI0033F94097